MKFSNLPKEVQVIAAECLAAKISIKSGLVPAGQAEPAKEQARQVREAFIALYEVEGKSLLTNSSNATNGLLPASPTAQEDNPASC
ncbi:hypothetical protein B2M27_23255 [Kluyvera intermedia]|uniref:Uncharacterized protein n=1 Tax=Kluyvera intermedia TaxID=61648 RepID=A0ABX3U8Z9_KLUIN|nr:hypothetical protein [Kluyvera intermedia]ORJ48001.1 hypothetical protein B2M27_23255 [Kluyvera intermedia]